MQQINLYFCKKKGYTLSVYPYILHNWPDINSDMQN